MKDKETGEASEEVTAPETPPNRGISKLDLVMRIVGAISTMGSAIAVGANTQMRPLFADFNSFRARFNHLPTFWFFVIANGITFAYLILSLALSIFHLVKSNAKVTRTVLIVLDMVILALLTAGASSAAAVVHLARKGGGNGNGGENWGAVCEKYNSFCERVSGALVGSFIGILVVMLLILMSSVALSRAKE